MTKKEAAALCEAGYMSVSDYYKWLKDNKYLNEKGEFKDEHSSRLS